MAEGPVVHHYAKKLKEVLQGREGGTNRIRPEETEAPGVLRGEHPHS